MNRLTIVSQSTVAPTHPDRYKERNTLGGITLTTRVQRIWTIVVCAVLLASCNNWFIKSDLNWDSVNESIEDEFPNLPSLTTVELAELLSSRTKHVILLDAREADEFEVSHLADAYHVASDATAASEIAANAPNAIVVVYCSVGYRSAALVERLRARGYTNAVNLKGSIFKWAEEGRPVYRDDKPVEQVHPYDTSWGVLLPARLWSFTAVDVVDG